jgi:hypothetical protein
VLLSLSSYAGSSPSIVNLLCVAIKAKLYCYCNYRKMCVYSFLSIFFFLGNLALCGAFINFAHHRMEEVKIKKCYDHCTIEVETMSLHKRNRRKKMLVIVVFYEMSSLLGENSCLFYPFFMPRKKSCR